MLPTRTISGTLEQRCTALNRVHMHTAELAMAAGGRAQLCGTVYISAGSLGSSLQPHGRHPNSHTAVRKHEQQVRKQKEVRAA